MRRERSFTKLASLTRLMTIYALLEQEGPLTAREVGEMIHCSTYAASEYIAAMHANKLIRVADWKRTARVSGVLAAAYAVSNRPDKPRPEREDHYAVHKRYRQRVKKERPERHMEMYRKEAAARRLRNPPKPRRDKAALAIFGPA